MSWERATEFSSFREDDLKKITVTIKDVEQAEIQDAGRFVVRELGGFLPP